MEREAERDRKRKEGDAEATGPDGYAKRGGMT
jgi:hypothetical protein